MRVVAGVDSVHTAAAVCDALQDRLTAGDSLVVVTVDEDGSRDAADAANVVQVRLPDVDITVDERIGDPGAEILAAARGADAAEVVVGRHRGVPGSGPNVGTSTRFLLRELEIPVLVVPVPQLAPE